VTTQILKSLALVLLIASHCFAEEYWLNPETDLEQLCKQIKAGDSIVLENGFWKDVNLEFDSLSGTESSPVSIVAETPGKVVLSGKTKFQVSGQHVIVSGFVFRDCFDVDHVFKMRSDKKVTASHCRITECVFEQTGKTDSDHNTKWLSVYGSNNRVDHCYFEGKTTLGSTLVVWIGEEPEKHRIDHNHFGPRPKLGQNGGETIRIGTSKVSEFPCETIVEENYFYHCDGEAEIISSKSCGNVFRHNVFEQCAGALTLRHGHRCVVDGNVFIGNERPGTGGVRIIGQGHRVINNYFEGLRGDRVRAAISLMNGIPDGPLNGYAPVKDAVVAHNTLIDCKSSIEIGVGAGTRNRTVVPEGCLLANNVFSSGEWNPLLAHVDPSEFVWQGNKQQLGIDDNQLVGLEPVDLHLRRAADGLFRPTDRRSLRTKKLTKVEIKTDFDGEPRGETVFAGCDDSRTLLRNFASPSNTGPTWWRSAKNFSATILMDRKILAETRVRIEQGDQKLKLAMEKLIEDADAALQVGPWSVTDKERLPPSGDKHDYASYSRYWWPDPDKPDGLPYIRRDGETNPDSQSLKTSDRQRIGAVGINTETLGLAYYLTGEERYAEKAAEILRVWFLDPATRMNPNVNHAQCRPGHNNGTKSGVLDGRMMTRALEGSLLIAGSTALTDVEREGLKAWAGEYFDWLTTAEIALDEAASENNHGSFYDAQAMYFALYSGNRKAAEQIAQNFVQKRVLSQIKTDGSMPEEMARTRPLFYSNYNLHAMFMVAHLAEKVDVDVWNAGDSRLRVGLDYLAPYADPGKQWPHPTIKNADRMKMFAILLMADRAYPDGNYLQMVEKLPVEERKIRRENLAFPIMR